MAHEIEGNNAFFTGKPAWHNLGTVLTDAPNVQEAWKLAYPFELFKLDLEATLIDADGNKQYMPIETPKAIIRSDGKHIGTVGRDYELEQPYEVLSFFEPYIESGLVKLEAGGSLREGSRMWALGKIKNSESEIIEGDTVKAYLLAATSFDGSLARLVKFCDTRVVCANTLAIAKSENTTQWSARHTKNMRAKMTEISQNVSQALAAHKQSVEAYRYLATKPMSTQVQTRYIEDVVSENLDKKEWSAKLQTKVNIVIDLLDTQRGLEYVPAIRGTAWQAYNAVSEYVTHHAARNEDTRLNNQWFGDPSNLNQRALEMALAA